MALEKVELGSPGIAYVRERLSRGKRLASYVQEKLDFHRGTAFTYLPASANPEERLDFESGGKLPTPNEPVRRVTAKDGTEWRMTPKPDSGHKLEECVRSFLAHSAEGICVFEDEVASPKDPYLTRSRAPKWFLGEDVYHVLHNEDLDVRPDWPDNVVRSTISLASSWLFVCVFSFVPALTPLPDDGARVPDELLRSIAARAQMVVVDAYDGEGFVFWLAAGGARC